MNNYQLAICIPAKNEEFLTETLDDLIRHTGDETHIFVGLDGDMAVKPIPQHERVTIFYSPVTLGQRGMTKQLARLAKGATYFAKTDAHVSVSENFGVEMIKAMEKAGPDATLAPIMRNLWAFDWVCEDGHKRYQGPSGPCKEPGCDKPTKKDICWIAKSNPQSTSFLFDSEPHFQYFKSHTRTEKYKTELKETGFTESMSLQGSFFMMTMKRYWELDVDDESFGSWGTQGALVASKTWLSGGRVLIFHGAYYAHMFRTQGGDFGFPYEQSGHGVNKAKKMTKELFWENKWPQQVRPLSWLVERFWPVDGWSQADFDKIKEEGRKFEETRAPGTPTKGIVYYTSLTAGDKILTAVQNQLTSIGLPIVSTSLKPINFGKNFVVEGQRGNITMFKQILKALEESDADIVFMCEDDVLYHPSHFEFTPPDRTKVYYNQNTWQTRVKDGFAVRYTCKTVSQLCAYRDVLIKHYRERMRRIETEGRYDGKMGYEPGAANRAERVDNLISETFESSGPNVDLRHDNNLTGSKWSPNDFRHQRYCRNWREGTTPKWAEEIVKSLTK